MNVTFSEFLVLLYFFILLLHSLVISTDLEKDKSVAYTKSCSITQKFSIW